MFPLVRLCLKNVVGALIGAVKNLVSDTTRETEVIVVIDLAFREMVSDTKFFKAP